MKTPKTQPLFKSAALNELLDVSTLQPTLQMVRCPNCGSPAARYYQPNQVQTQCSACDYYLSVCAHTGRVVEAYAPGIPARR